VTDGVENESLTCSGWVYPGITGNTVSNNILINSDGVEWENRPKESAAGTTNNTNFTGNTMYRSRTEAVTAEGWTDPDRTLKTYLESLGYTIDSDDGFIEFFIEARQQRKGYWRSELTSEPIKTIIFEQDSKYF